MKKILMTGAMALFPLFATAQESPLDMSFNRMYFLCRNEHPSCVTTFLDLWNHTKENPIMASQETGDLKIDCRQFVEYVEKEKMDMNRLYFTFMTFAAHSSDGLRRSVSARQGMFLAMETLGGSMCKN